MIDSELFTCMNKDTYPPFKNGLYLEEFFFNRIMSSNFKTKRKFIGSELDETHYKTAISQIKNNLKLYENISE